MADPTGHPVLKTKPTLQEVQGYIAAVLAYRGFDKQAIQDEVLMLCEEVGELAKAIRKQNGVRMAVDSKETNVRHEIADVFWMITSIANRLNIDLEQALREKEEINKQRTWR